MTSQSTNMALAMEAYGWKHEVEDKENFYMPSDHCKERGMYTFRKVDSQEVYSRLASGYEEAFQVLNENLNFDEK